MPTFDRLQIGLTGSVEPSNFTIEIYEWNITSASAQLRTTVASGVTRTTLSTYNGGTLNGSNYGISGITGNDYYLKLTANNTCHTDASLSLREPAYALSVHNQVPITSMYGSGNVLPVTFTGGIPPTVTTSQSHYDLANFDDVFYLADDATNFPTVGYGTTFSTNFTFTHLGTYDLSDTLQTGKWSNGVLDVSSMTLEQTQTSPYKTYRVLANQTPGIEADNTGTTYYSQYRLTFNPSNTSRTFIIYWAGSNV